MTNMQIIATELMTRGIKEDVDTYAGWSRRGYQVQKGSKALFQTRIWKPVNGKKNTEAEDMEHLILVKASFFGASQVKEAEEAKAV